jgi:hypothetical protein
MPDFTPQDPYPLLAWEELENEAAREHAKDVDAWLGFRMVSVEAGIPKTLSRRTGQELWQHIPMAMLLTPYLEIRALLAHLSLPAGSTVVDLGCAYGRMAFVIGRHHPELTFVGYEFVLDRVLEGRRCLAPFGYTHVRLEVADLSSRVFKPRPADAYFIYDYGTSRAIEKTLHDLEHIARKRKIVVVGRGRTVREAIKGHYWLSPAPIVSANFTIYWGGV